MAQAPYRTPASSSIMNTSVPSSAPPKLYPQTTSVRPEMQHPTTSHQRTAIVIDAKPNGNAAKSNATKKKSSAVKRSDRRKLPIKNAKKRQTPPAAVAATVPPPAVPTVPVADNLVAPSQPLPPPPPPPVPSTSLAAILSPEEQKIKDAEEWAKLRSIKSTEWDNHMRKQLGNVPAESKREAQRKRRQMKLDSALHATATSTDTSLTEIHANSLTDATADSTTKKDCPAIKTVDDANELPTPAANQPPPTSPTTPSRKPPDATSSRSAKRVRSITIKLSPIKSVRKTVRPNSIQKRRKSTRNMAAKSAEKKPLPSSAAKQAPQSPPQPPEQPPQAPPPPPPSVQLPQHMLNLNSLLETPFKETISALPFTPRVLLAPLIHHNDHQLDTPAMKLTELSITHNTSTLKMVEFPTPSMMPITPGASLIFPPPSISPRTDAPFCNNRPTDYSSGSSYYRPDESDDVDKKVLMELKKDAAAKVTKTRDPTPPPPPPPEKVHFIYTYIFKTQIGYYKSLK